jgi:hypothetical protein
VSTGIEQIRERVEDVLENIVSNESPQITLRRWLDSRDILTGEHKGTAAKTTRQFQVLALPVRDAGFLGGGSVDQWQTLRITIRYYMSDSGDGWVNAHTLAAADSAEIYEALMDDGQWVGTSAEGAALGDAVPLTASPTLSNLAFQVLHYRVLYNRCNAGSGGTWTAHFYTLGALLAYLDTKPKGTAAKLVNERTQEIIGVWVKDDIEGTWCDFSKADGTEFADGVDIISQGAGTWAITYGTGIVVSTDAAEFYGFARLANSDILGTGTTTIYTRAKIHTYTSQADIDAVTGTTDQVVALVGSDGTLTSHQRWTGSAWVVIEPSAGTPAALKYTSLASLFAAAGSQGARAAFVESSGGAPLIWYAYSTRSSKWRPVEYRWDNLTAAEQAVWDSLIAAGSDPNTWATTGVQLSGATDQSLIFEGLHAAGSTPILATGGAGLFSMVLRVTSTISSGYAIAEMLWGSSRNNGLGLSVRKSSTTTFNNSGTILRAGVRTFRLSGGFGAPDDDTPCSTAGAVSVDAADDFEMYSGTITNLTTPTSHGGTWGDSALGAMAETSEDCVGVMLTHTHLAASAGTSTFSGMTMTWPDL